MPSSHASSRATSSSRRIIQAAGLNHMISAAIRSSGRRQPSPRATCRHSCPITRFSASRLSLSASPSGRQITGLNTPNENGDTASLTIRSRGVRRRPSRFAHAASATVAAPFSAGRDTATMPSSDFAAYCASTNRTIHPPASTSSNICVRSSAITAGAGAPVKSSSISPVNSSTGKVASVVVAALAVTASLGASPHPNAATSGAAIHGATSNTVAPRQIH